MRIVQMMGGKMWVENNPDQGCTFHFTAEFGDVTGNSKVAEPGRTREEDLSEVYVLIVDDNATNRRILYETATRWGMRAEVAESGAMALTMLNAAHASGHPFGLVLLDEQMPLMDGFGVIDAVRSNPQLAGAAIMMLTSSNQTASAARCRSLGVETYLIKPIHQPELHTAIRKALGNTETAQKHKDTTEDLAAERPLCILLAEDNAVNQKLAISMLTKMGHDVTLAVNGVEAVAKSAAQLFDLIFMDVQMPMMDGFEATRAIRTREQQTGGHIPYHRHDRTRHAHRPGTMPRSRHG